MKVRSGHVPTDITYIFGATQKVTQTWDDVDQSEEEREFIDVIPAFCSDSDNEKTLATGVLWAERSCSVWDPNTRTQNQTATVQQVARENLPMEGLKVVTLEHRGNGGRAYKVITPDGFYFDLREDILLDLMKTEGISPGGILNGKFLWARVGSEMKLVRAGSALYEALLEAGERALMSNISIKALKVGTLYETKKGDRGLFLGFVDTWEYRLVWPNKQSTWNNTRRWVYSHGSPTKDKPTLRRSLLKKQQLWFQMPTWMFARVKGDTTQQEFNKAMLSTDLAHIEIKKAHTMVKKLKDNYVIPTDIVEQLRMKALAYREKTWNDWSKDGRTSEPYSREDYTAGCMKEFCMRPHGAPEVPITGSLAQELHRKLDQEL